MFDVAARYPSVTYLNLAEDNNLSWNDRGEDDEEGAFHLGEVSSDVEMDPAELDGIDSDEDQLEDDSMHVLSPTSLFFRLTRI